MGFRAEWLRLGSVLVAGLLARPAAAQAPRPLPTPTTHALPAYTSPQIAYDALDRTDRALVRAVVDRPTLRTKGQVESFNCQPTDYYWLLDNPDVAVRLWRALGATCTDIHREGDQRFGWRDTQGNQLHWRTVLHSPTQRIWYAEGQGKPGMLFPSVPVRAVVVLHHEEGIDRAGKTAIRHQAELIVQTESHAVALAARLLGASAPHLAEQYASQIEIFFGALAWYLDRDADQRRTLLAEATGKKRPVRTAPNNARRPRPTQDAEAPDPR